MTRELLGGVKAHAPLFIWLSVAFTAIPALAADPMVTIVSGGKSISYTKVTQEAPFRIQASGPSTLLLTLRQKLPSSVAPAVPGTLTILMDGKKLASYSMVFPLDPNASCMEEKDFIPSVLRTVRLKVPSGNHVFEASMTGLGGAIRAEVVPASPPPIIPSPSRGEGASIERVFGLFSVLSLGYDSNILQLSPSDLKLFREDRDYAPNNGLRRIDSNIASTDDFPIVLELTGTAQGRPWGKRRTMAELKGHSYFYPRNIIKWHGDAGIAFVQELSPGPEVRISYVYQTPTYLRNLSYFDPNTSAFITYRKAWFVAHTGEVSLSQNLTQTISLDAGYAFEAPIFRDVFKERDSFVHKGMGGIRVRPWEPLRIRLGYAYKSSLARGNIPSTPRIEVDTSYSQSTLLTSAELDLERLAQAKLLLNAEGSFGFKNFTTGNPEDTVHYHRQDVTNSLIGRIVYRISQEWSVGVSYAYTLVNSNAKPANLEAGDEPTSYREDIAFLTITFVSPSFGPHLKE